MPDADREKWDAKYAARGASIAPPSPFIERMLARVPKQGRCLDVAGGTGRNARLLAAHGLDVTIADVSPVGLDVAQREADEAGLTIHTLVHDVEAEGLPAGPWDVIVQVHFLHRPLFAQYAAALVPGGYLLLEHPTMANLERHPQPSKRWLLLNWEITRLLSLYAPELEVDHLEEGWGESGRYEARVLARRPLLLD